MSDVQVNEISTEALMDALTQAVMHPREHVITVKVVADPATAARLANIFSLAAEAAVGNNASVETDVPLGFLRNAGAEWAP